MDSITISEFLEGGWQPAEETFKAPEPEDFKYETMLRDPKHWANYSSPVIYETDVRLRAYLTQLFSSDEYKAHPKKTAKIGYRLLFEQLYQKKYDPKVDSKDTTAISRVFAYYSTRIQKVGTVGGVKQKKIYTLSKRRFNKLPPYSLRLRIEMLEAEMKEITGKQLIVPKDDLKAGHARNPRTEANMARRREEGRERARRYKEQFNRKHQHESDDKA